MRNQANATSTRRLLLAAAILAGAAILATAARPFPGVPDARTPATGLAQSPDAWLAALTGKHRQLFDAPQPDGGIPLVHIMNYYDTYNQAYNVPDKDINAVLTFYGGTTFYGLKDAMWAKYKLGEFLKTNDPATAKPAVANPWRVSPTVIGMQLPQASVESLQKRGATFIVCNNALTIFSGLVAKAQGLDAQAVYADMKANILPGVTLVPAMVIAIEKAQKQGLSYHRQ
jgi:intracellular sulfur oxidation DsrE/DsrF family protein